MDFSSNKKDIKITNFMPHFCAIEKAIIKRVKLLTNIQGDSPYTFFPRNFYHLTYSKYLYTRAHLLHTYTFTHLHNHWKFDIAPPAESSHFTWASNGGKKSQVHGFRSVTLPSLSQLHLLLAQDCQQNRRVLQSVTNSIQPTFTTGKV